jgi:hypothetical protein
LQSIGESPIKENCPSEVMYPKENTNSYECWKCQIKLKSLSCLMMKF